jgi:RNA polymerase sigma factor for flagellar operon FliA
MEEASERVAAEAMMVAHLDWIDRVTASLTRRYGLGGDDADDVAAWIRLRLMEDDYAALRKFRGDSSIQTYLLVVVTSLFRDYRAGHWGRWRPSAAALRVGPLAVRLETLVYRDGLTLAEAGQVLRSSDPDVPDDRHLAELLGRLPVRSPLRPGEAPLLDGIPAPDEGDAGIQAAEAATQRARVRGALERALETLSQEDRLILRLRFWQGSSIGDIARALRLEQKPLYRRIERLSHVLRAELEREGIDRTLVAEVLTGDVVL